MGMIKNVKIDTNVDDKYIADNKTYRLAGEINITYTDDQDNYNYITYMFIDGNDLPKDRKDLVLRDYTYYRLSSQFAAYTNLITSPQGFTLSSLVNYGQQHGYSNGLFWRHRPAYMPYGSTDYLKIAETDPNSKDATPNNVVTLPKAKL